MAKNSVGNTVTAYLTKHPDADAKEVAVKYGIKPQYVYVLRSKLRSKLRKAAATVSEPTGVAALIVPSTPVPTPAPKPEPIDMVNEPPHYTDGGMDVIDFIEAKKLDYHLGNVVKYISRAGKKDNELQDLSKAQWYLNRAIEARQIAASIKSIVATATVTV